ncbi:MAG: MFS transporter [Microlunatus sp.]|nr:MFS transporter [Microlunatus sp.]MDN5770091.1 MFS transporter [Microlunatus sp.]
MASGFGAYREVLGPSEARAFTLAGIAARLPMSMTGLGIVLLIAITTGSYGRAGLVTAVATLITAVAAPWWGRLIDQIGQARVLIAATVIYNLSVGALITTVLLHAPFAVTLITALGVGLGFSSAGACVRARWSYRLRGKPLLNTAFAWEAVLDEVVFMIGPVLATFLATSLHPSLGLAAGGLVGLVGALALASQRRTEPPLKSRVDRRSRSSRLSAGLLVPIVLACTALGVPLGGMEVVIIAFAGEAGILPYAGFIVMAWAIGSLIAAVLTGTIAWTAPPTKRFRIAAMLLAVSLVPLPFVVHPLPIAGLLILSGLFIAPTLIASVAVTQDAVPADRLTEALGWTSMGLAGGVGLGAAVLGQVVDIGGSQAGFYGAIAAGLVLIVAALCVRTRTTPDGITRVRPDTSPADPEPAGAQTPFP